MENLKTNNEKSDFFKKLLFGIIIGMAAIMPGFSGGVLAIALGVYAPMIDAVTRLRSEFKRSVVFLLPLGIGAAIGMFLFGVIMEPLLSSFETEVVWFFTGMIAGSVPSLIKEANSRGFRIMYILPFLITLAIGLLISETVSETSQTLGGSPLLFLLGGGILALGIIIPGISSSFVLIQMGVYDEIISAFVSFDLNIILWVVLGIAVFLLLSLHLINLAFKKFHGYAYFAALGFLTATLAGVIPGAPGIIDALLLLLGAAGVYVFMRRKEK